MRKPKIIAEWRELADAYQPPKDATFKQEAGAGEFDEFLRVHIVKTLVYGWERGLRGEDLRKHVDDERRLCIRKHNERSGYVYWQRDMSNMESFMDMLLRMVKHHA